MKTKFKNDTVDHDVFIEVLDNIVFYDSMHNEKRYKVFRFVIERTTIYEIINHVRVLHSSKLPCSEASIQSIHIIISYKLVVG